MDQTLAQIYGTMEPVTVSEEEIQKTAQLQLLEKIAEASGIDLNSLTDDQIREAYEELQRSPELTKTAAYQPAQQGLSKEAAEMFYNSDTMGRIVAHAFVDEMKQIQKAAMLKAAAEGEEESEEDEKEDKKENPLVAAMKAKQNGNGDEEKEKEAAAMVEKRAYEILAANGLVRQDGSIVSPQEIAKTAEQNQAVVDTAALQLLENMGYPVEWK